MRVRAQPRGRFWQSGTLGFRGGTGGGAQSASPPLSVQTSGGLLSLTELTTIAAAATTDTTIQIPANAIVARVEALVVTAIPTAATFTYGVAGATARYGTGIATAAGTYAQGLADGNRLYLSAIAIRFTPNLTPGAATGQVQTTIFYYGLSG